MKLPEYHTQAFDLLVAGATAAGVALASTGLALWQRSIYVSDNTPRDKHSTIYFNGYNIFGLCLFLSLATVSVVGVYLFVSTCLHKALSDGRCTTVEAMQAQLRNSDAEERSTTQMGDEVAGANSSSGGPQNAGPWLLGRLTRTTQVRVAAGMYGGAAVLFFVLGIVAGAVWARDPLFTCGVIFCVGDPASFPASDKQPANGISFNATLGMMCFFSLIPIGVIMLVRLVSLRRVLLASREDALSTRNAPVSLHKTTAEEAMTCSRGSYHRGNPTTSHHPRWRGDFALGILPVASFLVCFSVLTFYLPNDTRRFLGSKIANLALMQATYGTNGGNFTAPEVPGAWFRTRNINVSEHLTLKLFPGNVFFYVYLLLLMVTMWGLRLTTLGRTWVRSPVQWWPRPGWNYGDVLLTSLTTLFTFFFFWYWVHDHNFKKFWSSSKGEDATGYIQTSERWGRATGQLATFFLSLLMFPASRCSSLPLFRAMGLSWESFLWAHRMLGYAMLLATLAHIVFFLKNFHLNGVLRSNLTSLPTLVSRKKVRNDFTMIPVTWATLLVFLFMGVFAFYPLRRRCFELFYYSHLVGSYILFPAVLWHASSGWEYLVPGLTLWILDRFIRMYRSGAPVEVLRCAIVDEQTLRIDFRCAPGGRAQPGQYVFLNVPEVSLLQWHPFTTLATSAVDGIPADQVSREDTRLTVFIKVMSSSHSWTGQLYQRVAAAEVGGTAPAEGAPRPAPIFTLRVDGPCGSPLTSVDFADYNTVYFVAGGIGVVPCAAVYHALHDSFLYHRQLPEKVTSQRFPSAVKLLWVCRSAEFVNAFAPTLEQQEAEAAPEDGTVFERVVFMTGRASEWEASPTSSPRAAAGLRTSSAFPLSSPTPSAISTPPNGSNASDGLREAAGEAPSQLTPDASDAAIVAEEKEAKVTTATTPAVDGAVESLPQVPASGTQREDDDGMGSSSNEPVTRRMTLYRGRPNWLTELAASMQRDALPAPDLGDGVMLEEDGGASARGAADTRERVLVFACGPSKLTREVGSIAEKLGAAFHREEFNL